MTCSRYSVHNVKISDVHKSRKSNRSGTCKKRRQIVKSRIIYNFNIDVCYNSKPGQVFHYKSYIWSVLFFSWNQCEGAARSQHVAAYLFLGLLGHSINCYNNQRATRRKQLKIILRWFLVRYFLNHSINRIGSIDRLFAYFINMMTTIELSISVYTKNTNSVWWVHSSVANRRITKNWVLDEIGTKLNDLCFTRIAC